MSGRSKRTEAKPFFYLTIVAIGSGFFGLTLVWSIYNLYMPLLLGDFVESRSLRGAVMGLDNALAVVLLPVVGAWSDRVRGPLGMRLPFIVVGMPLAAGLFLLLPLGAASLGLLLVIDIMFLLAMMLHRAPVIALMPDHTPAEKRSTANGLINLMGGLGGLLAFFVLAPLFDLSRAYPFVLGGLVLGGAFLFLFTTTDRHPPYAEAATEEGHALRWKSLRALWHSERRGERTLLFAIALYFIGFSGVEALFSVYATEALGLSGGAAGLLLGFFSLAFVLMALPAGLVGSRFGKVPTMLVALLALALLFVTLPFITTPAPVRVVLFCAGLLWALVNVQAYPLVADLGGRTRIGFYTGMYYLFSMGGAILGPALMGAVMDVFGSRSLFWGVSVALALGAGLLFQGNRMVRTR